ncbi:unnamed protein product [Lepidochelys kempii]
MPPPSTKGLSSSTTPAPGPAGPTHPDPPPQPHAGAEFLLSQDTHEKRTCDAH